MSAPARALLAAAVLALAAAGPVDGLRQALPEGGRLSVDAEPIELTGGRLTGLAAEGAWVLRSSHPEFGGLSGLLVEDGRLLAVTDQGWWFGARLATDDGLRLEDARLAPMRDPGGETYGKAGGDAEGLARLADTLAVSFERDHRVMRLRETGLLGGTIHSRAFERLPSNKGLEALATLADGRLIALAEGRDNAEAPMFVLSPDGVVSEGRLPLAGRHSVTGADVGPDGRLYLVLRHFSVLTGVSIRVVRYRLGDDGLPRAETAETLAAFEQASGIDNMEGIALERADGERADGERAEGERADGERADGATRLWLISDDNFNAIQRTLLLRFEVLD